MILRRIDAAGQRALAFLDSNGDCASDCADLLFDYFHSSQIWGSPNLFAKYRGKAPQP